MIDCFNDILDTANDSIINVKATIFLLPTKESGRTMPISTQQYKYRPNHNFGESSNRNFYIGQVDFEKTIKPGETSTATIMFLDAAGLRSELQIGREWRLQEGLKLVAIGKVTDIISKGDS